MADCPALPPPKKALAVVIRGHCDSRGRIQLAGQASVPPVTSTAWAWCGPVGWHPCLACARVSTPGPSATAPTHLLVPLRWTPPRSRPHLTAAPDPYSGQPWALHHQSLTSLAATLLPLRHNCLSSTLSPRASPRVACVVGGCRPLLSQAWEPGARSGRHLWVVGLSVLPWCILRETETL